MSPLLIFHIATASIALLGGVAAMSLRKGSPGHRTGGNVFVIGMVKTCGRMLQVREGESRRPLTEIV